MKKIAAIFPLILLLAACGGNSDKSNSTPVDSSATASQPAANGVSSNPDYQKGLALVAKSNCLTCHKVGEKVIGPAFKDVANKYAGNDSAVVHLAHKVISGGSGVWGTIQMSPHPEVNEADAEQMVKYILLLKS